MSIVKAGQRPAPTPCASGQQPAPDAEYDRLLAQEDLILEATELISELLADQDVSRKELAERLGQSKGHVSQLLSGQRNMTLRTLSDLAFTLGHRFRLRLESLDEGRLAPERGGPRRLTLLHPRGEESESEAWADACRSLSATCRTSNWIPVRRLRLTPSSVEAHDASEKLLRAAQTRYGRYLRESHRTPSLDESADGDPSAEDGKFALVS